MLRLGLLEGDHEDVAGIEISDARNDIHRAEEILQELGQPGFARKGDILADVLASAY